MARKPTYEELEQRVEELEREVSKRKKAEDALRENEEELEAIFNAVGEGIAILEKTGRVTKINRAMRQCSFEQPIPAGMRSRQTRCAVVFREI